MNCPLCGSYGAPVFGRCCEESIRIVGEALQRLAARNADFARNCPATVAYAVVEARWAHAAGGQPWGCLVPEEVVIVRDDSQGVTVCWVPLGAKAPWSPGRDAEEVRLERVWVFTQDWVAQVDPDVRYPRGKLLLLHLEREALVPWSPIADSVAEKLAARPAVQRRRRRRSKA